MTLEELKTFCGHDEERPQYHHPWVKDGFTWATDAAMLVRLDSPLEGVEENPKAIATQSAFDKYQTPIDAKWQPVPAVTPVYKFVPCVFCDGTGTCQCPECEADHKCGKCDGDGGCDQHESVDVLGRLASTVRMSKFGVIRGIEMTSTYDDPKTPIAFRFPGGIGLLMPMNKS